MDEKYQRIGTMRLTGMLRMRGGYKSVDLIACKRRKMRCS